MSKGLLIVLGLLAVLVVTSNQLDKQTQNIIELKEEVAETKRENSKLRRDIYNYVDGRFEDLQKSGLAYKGIFFTEN